MARVFACTCSCVFVCLSPDPKRSSADRTFRSRESTLLHTNRHTLEAQSIPLTLTRLPTYTKSHPDHTILTNTHTHTIKCDWASRPLNESGWLGPLRVGLTFPCTSSPLCACVFLWVSGYKLSGLRHFTSNVTDLNEMTTQTGQLRKGDTERYEGQLHR